MWGCLFSQIRMFFYFVSANQILKKPHPFACKCVFNQKKKHNLCLYVCVFLYINSANTLDAKLHGITSVRIAKDGFVFHMLYNKVAYICVCVEFVVLVHVAIYWDPLYFFLSCDFAHTTHTYTQQNTVQKKTNNRF